MRDQGSSEEEDDVRQGLSALNISLVDPVWPSFHTHQSRAQASVHPFPEKNLRVREVEGLGQDHAPGKQNSSGHTPEAGIFPRQGALASLQLKGVGQGPVLGPARPLGTVCGCPLHLACYLPGGDSGQMGMSYERDFLRPTSLLLAPLSPSYDPAPALEGRMNPKFEACLLLFPSSKPAPGQSSLLKASETLTHTEALMTEESWATTRGQLP